MDSNMNQSAPDGRFPGLQGAHNFRDVGGYPTTDGRQVATGRVFRSGTLAALTDADHAILSSLGIRVICDFRSNRERANKPSRFAENVAFDIWVRDHEMSAGDLVGKLSEPGVDPERSRQVMIDAYRTLPYEQADSYRELFRRIAADDMPLVFHCSAGKDRTGIAAALLLDILGVARETVIEDYVLTDLFFEQLVSVIGNDPSWARLANVDPSVWAPMMRADNAYIEMMFQTIEQTHGSSEGFLREAMGLDSDVITAVRDNLLV
jgi:protein-tyrosine phosphatase